MYCIPNDDNVLHYAERTVRKKNMLHLKRGICGLQHIFRSFEEIFQEHTLYVVCEEFNLNREHYATVLWLRNTINNKEQKCSLPNNQCDIILQWWGAVAVSVSDFYHSSAISANGCLSNILIKFLHEKTHCFCVSLSVWTPESAHVYDVCCVCVCMACA